MEERSEVCRSALRPTQEGHGTAERTLDDTTLRAPQEQSLLHHKHSTWAVDAAQRQSGQARQAHQILPMLQVRLAQERSGQGCRTGADRPLMARPCRSTHKRTQGTCSAAAHVGCRARPALPTRAVRIAALPHRTPDAIDMKYVGIPRSPYPVNYPPRIVDRPATRRIRSSEPAFSTCGPRSGSLMTPGLRAQDSSRMLAPGADPRATR